MAKTNSGLLEFKDAQKVLIALDDATSEVKKAVVIDGDGVETDIAGENITVEALSVTENGTYSEEGKAYSPVTVNVAGGSSDFSTAEVTIVGSSAGTVEYEYSIPVVEAESPIYLMTPIASDDDQKITVPLHKGMLAFNGPEGALVSGSATYDSETHTVLVTGNCSIKGFEIM